MKRIFVMLGSMCVALAAMAQDIIVKNDGSTLTVYNMDVAGNTIYYQLENSEDAPTNRLKTADVLIIRRADGTKWDPNAPVEEAPVEEAVVEVAPVEAATVTPVATAVSSSGVMADGTVDLSQFHGYLLERGNHVYIPTDSPYDYERAGRERLKKLMAADGYWKVVDSLNQAHFVLLFFTSTEGIDYSESVLRLRENYRPGQRILFNGWTFGINSDDLMFTGQYHTSEDVDDNEEAASWMANYGLRSFKNYKSDYHGLRKYYGESRAQYWYR